MATIDAAVVINAPVDKVWDVVSDIDNEPKFWKGTKSIRNISKDGNTIIREVTIAFKDSKCMQTITLQPKERIFAEFTEGIINGTKTIQLIPEGEKTRLEAIWDMKLSGVMGMFTGMVKKHIKSGTEQALEAIKQEIEKP
ncbi:type II toxin-antitoxin system RatA family toxin [Candidatus Nitrosotenuis cloacae]|uniref:Cyclase n=1 Tax=Candidatus Nitrosotenuis cloacae TaxID=1603555 RepID=A0A3G1B084_9ARCH|nr:SRPBCC family protein [Candidatus Nitrosotenuis cloacae]AJZ75532.1 cyclase [Candidatus Nitrosotenuis cloacae]